MVVIVSKEGQLANRIFHASSFIVNAKENNYRVNHLFFKEYYKFFSESLDQGKSSINFLWKRDTLFVSILQSILTFFVKSLLKLKITKLPFFEIIEYSGYQQGLPPFDLNDKKFIKKAKSKFLFVYGWLFSDSENQKKHRQLLIDIWRPNKIYRDNIKNYWDRYKKNHDVLLGVHMRGGDYKNFEGGKWYYTPRQYSDKIKEIASLKIFNGKKLGFIICTNEKNVSLPESNNYSIFNEERHFIEDLYLLAKCDYIIGPPSTFSMWASFYGGVPLYKISEINNQISDEVFKTKSVVF